MACVDNELISVIYGNCTPDRTKSLHSDFYFAGQVYNAIYNSLQDGLQKAISLECNNKIIPGKLHKFDNFRQQMAMTISTGCCWVTLPLMNFAYHSCLTHWGRVTHICVSKLIIIGSNNGLSPGRHQAIIWTNAGIKLIGWTLRNKLQCKFNRN